MKRSLRFSSGSNEKVGALGAVTYASTLPPAASILARAEADTGSPRTV